MFKILILLALVLNLSIQKTIAIDSSTESGEEEQQLEQESTELEKRAPQMPKRTQETESLKSSVELYLEYQELLTEPSISTMKKLAIEKAYHKLKAKLTAYMNESPKNKSFLTRIVAQVVLEKKLKKGNDKVASNDFNSITGFWGR